MPNGQESNHPSFDGSCMVTRFIEIPSCAFSKKSDQRLRSATSFLLRVSSWFLCRRVCSRGRSLLRKCRASGIR